MTAQRRHRRRTLPERETGAVSEQEEQAWDLSRPEPEKAEFAVPDLPAEGSAAQPVPSPEAEPEDAAGGETPARPEEADQPEPLPTVQSADSRVPEEARRMAAAPYGTARPGAKRPGTRPMTAPRRPEMPAVRRERNVPAGSAGEGVPSRVRVGYAPGRMNDEMTRQVHAQEIRKESHPPRDAKTYLERRNQPFYREEPAEEKPVRPAPGALRILIVAILVFGLLIIGFLILRGSNRPEGEEPQPQTGLISYECTADGLEMTAPADVTFSVKTEKGVQQLRLVRGEAKIPIPETRAAQDGETVTTEILGVDNAEGKAWMITLHALAGFEDTVSLQTCREGGDWMDTGYSSRVTVKSVAVTAVPEQETPQVTGTLAMSGEVTFTEETGDGSSAEEEAGESPLPEDAEEGEDSAEETVPGEGFGDAAEEEPEEEPAEEEPVGGEPEEEPAGEEETETPEAADAEESEDADEDDFREIGELRTVVPTATPAPQQEKPTATPPLTAEAAPEANPALITSTEIFTGTKTKKEKTYSRPAKEMIHMPEADQYTTLNLGVMTFRGDNFRRNAAAGSLSGAAESIRVIWSAEGGSARGASQTYYGYGWTGQPAIARWSKQVRAASNLYESKQEKEKLKEVIIAGLDGAIRFLDLDDGTLTRNSIKLGYPMRGTPSLHTRGAPFISVGQFARKMKNKTGKIGLRQYNLYNQKELKLLDGLDGKQKRALNDIGSFETSALIDRISDTLITAGSNGMLYLEALDSTFDYNAGVLTVSPSLTVMTSRAQGQKNTELTAVESSLAAYDKYVFYADMGGVLRCVDTNQLAPVWAVETGDSVMAAVALDLTANRELNLYTANMLNNRKKGDGSIQIRRFDALTGRETWCTDVGVYKGKKDKDDVGAKASPVIGQKGLAGLVYFTVTGLSEEGRSALGLTAEEPAALIALDKETGGIVWTAGLSSRSESSPVAVYDKDGNGWIIQAEQNGTIRLLEGLTGRELSSLQLEAEIEASPAVYNDILVIGTTGKGTAFIYGIEIKTLTEQESEGESDEVSGGA